MLVVALFVVALPSTVLLRGLMSVLAAVVMVTVAVMLGWFGWWSSIFGLPGGLDIRISAAGYL